MLLVTYQIKKKEVCFVPLKAWLWSNTDCNQVYKWLKTHVRMLNLVWNWYKQRNPVCFSQSDGFLKDNSNAAQRLLDGVNLVAQSVSELSVKPAKAVTSWLTDQIAPAYWKPNSLILVSDTHSPNPPPPSSNSRVDTFTSTGMFTSWRSAAITQSSVCRSQDKTRIRSDCVLTLHGQ